MNTLEDKKEVLKVLHDLGNNFGIVIHNVEELKETLLILRELFPKLTWGGGGGGNNLLKTAIITTFQEKHSPFLLRLQFKLYQEDRVSSIYEVTYSRLDYKSKYTPLSFIVDFSHVKH
jgi:hypothetical protein